MNINALTVSQVNTYIKAILDENVHLKNIYIVGEISNFLHYFRPYSYSFGLSIPVRSKPQPSDRETASCSHV